MSADERFEELLARLATGEITESEARAELAKSGGSTDELDALCETLALLDETGAQERDVLAAASNRGPAPGEDRVANVIYELSGTGPTGPTESTGPTRWPAVVGGLVLLAAAVVALVTVIGSGENGPDPDPVEPPPIFLGPGDDLACESPSGAVASYDLFRWTGELPDGHTFVVEIWRPGENSVLGDALLTSGDLEENEWQLTEEQSAALPREIRWEVILRGVNGEDVDWAEAFASLE